MTKDGKSVRAASRGTSAKGVRRSTRTHVGWLNNIVHVSHLSSTKKTAKKTETGDKPCQIANATPCHTQNNPINFCNFCGFKTLMIAGFQGGM